MTANVAELLTLPKSSNAFTEVKDSRFNETGSASPRRKVPRLDTDSDSASASRSLAASTARLISGASKSGPLILHLVGGDILRKPVKGDNEYLLLRRSIQKLLNWKQNEALPATNQAIYSACRTAVGIAKRGESLYDVLQKDLKECVTELLKSCKMVYEDPVEWLGIFVEICRWFESRISLLVSLLTYLDQDYVASNSGLKSTKSRAYFIFEEYIFGNSTIGDNLREGVKAWIEAERNTKSPHKSRSNIPLLIHQLSSHGQYSNFEEHYVSITRDYYRAESQRLFEEQQKDPQAFFWHVQARLQEEEQRNIEILPVGSWGLLRETTERALWNGRLVWLASETVGPYMIAKDFHSLERMYNLFARVGGLKTLCDGFRAFLTSTVVDLVKDTARDAEMVDRLLNIKHTANEAISKAFVADSPSLATSTSTPHKNADQNFVYALTDAFTTGFKARRNKPAEIIAKCLDKAMRRGQGAQSDAEFDSMLDDVLGLYRFSEDKDVFRRFYHQGLAKRLLLEKSASDDFEASMLKKMKEKYDPEFDMGENMFKDLALSRENMRDYHHKLDAESPGKKLTAMVLQRSAWPFSKNTKTVDLPPDMAKELVLFSKYYKEKHSGHVLDWDHGLGTATLKARFKPGAKELSVSLYQTVVLLLFNESLQLQFQDIKDQTRMDDAELRRTLQSLACGKKKVLKKIPPGRDVNDSDAFKFNADFDDPRAKIHINSVQAKVSPEESKRTNAAVESDRKLYLDAAIVRIMKANKTMTYEKLKTATIDAVKNHFVPQVDVIKQRVDSLVESDYLERDQTERNIFHYVA